MLRIADITPEASVPARSMDRLTNTVNIETGFEPLEEWRTHISNESRKPV